MTFSHVNLRIRLLHRLKNNTTNRRTSTRFRFTVKRTRAKLRRTLKGALTRRIRTLTFTTYIHIFRTSNNIVRNNSIFFRRQRRRQNRAFRGPSVLHKGIHDIQQSVRQSRVARVTITTTRIRLQQDLNNKRKHRLHTRPTTADLHLRVTINVSINLQGIHNISNRTNRRRLIRRLHGATHTDTNGSSTGIQGRGLYVRRFVHRFRILESESFYTV